MTGADKTPGPFAGKSWTKYYEARRSQSVRSLLTRALELFAAAGREPGRAIDLGCGEGTDTLELLQRGWRVLAVDSSEEGISRTRDLAEAAALTELLETRCAGFEDLGALPSVDLVYSAVSLPFCAPAHFEGLWQRIRAAVEPSGWISVQLFGPNDTWATNVLMTFLSRDGVEELLAGLEVHVLDERDEDGQAVSGPKHWHVFDVIAGPPEIGLR